MKAKIGMISQWYDPEGGSAAHPGIISRSLLRRGHKVDVVTGFPNYPSGTFSAGYRIKPYQRETIRGVTVHRSPLYPSHDTNPIRRAINYLSFAILASVVILAKLGKSDAILVHSTPATAAFPALALQALRRKPYVVHIQDLWPQTVTSSGFLEEQNAGCVERTLHRFCDLVYRHADSIAVTCQGLAELIAKRGIPLEKLVLVPNWCDEDALRPTDRDPKLAESLGISRRSNVMYAENLGDLQGLDPLIEAATALQDRHDIDFVLVGSGITLARDGERPRFEERHFRKPPALRPNGRHVGARRRSVGQLPRFAPLQEYAFEQTSGGASDYCSSVRGGCTCWDSSQSRFNCRA